MTSTAASKITIRLPRYGFEPNLHQLAAILAEGDGKELIILDFKAVKIYIPAAIVALIAKIKFWQRSGIKGRVINFKENPVSAYFQRMDFCSALGWDIPELFERHARGTDFVPILQVPPVDGDVGPIATQVAECIDPTKGESFKLLQYSSSEAILNARQHSGGEGFVSAQYYPSREMARLGVADSGIGIKESFRRNSSPHYFEGMTDLDALLIALKPEVSSTTHLAHPLYGHSPNKGVGLSMMRELMSQSLGYMSLISGTAWWYQEAKNAPAYGTFAKDAFFSGTICAVAFRRNLIDDYFAMLKEARVELGLQQADSVDRMFI